jgi:hypothetical protein
LKIVENVNKMARWQKPTSTDKKVCVLIELDYKPDKVIVKRLGVGGNRKFTELDVYDIPRK